MMVKVLRFTRLPNEVHRSENELLVIDNDSKAVKYPTPPGRAPCTFLQLDKESVFNDTMRSTGSTDVNPVVERLRYSNFINFAQFSDIGPAKPVVMVNLFKFSRSPITSNAS